MRPIPRQLGSVLRAVAHHHLHARAMMLQGIRPMGSASQSFLQKLCTDFASLEPLNLDDGLSTARVMLPDDANPACNVHGGTILKMIEQAGFVVASRLCNRARRPEEPPMMGTLAQIFQMDFFLPMYVGELAKLYAKPQFSPNGGVGVVVDVWAENVITGESRHTNHAVLCYAIVHAETAEPVACTDLNTNSPSATCCISAAPSPVAAIPLPNPPAPSMPVVPPAGSSCRTSEESAVNFVQLMLPGDCQRGNVVGGGVIMKLMDSAAGSCARKHCRSNVVTVSIETLTFDGQVLLGDVVHVHARMVFTSAKSMDCLVEVEVERLMTGERLPTTSGTFTFVSLNDDHRPQLVPTFLPQTEEEIRLFHSHSHKYEERRKRKAASKEVNSEA